jgi:hypothetical protein
MGVGASAGAGVEPTFPVTVGPPAFHAKITLSFTTGV